MQTLEITNFGGGIVDNVVSAPGRMQAMHNVELYRADDGAKIRQRSGLSPFTNRLGTGDQTIGGIFTQGDMTFAQSSKKLYDTSTGTAVSTPSGSTDAVWVGNVSTASSTTYQGDAFHVYPLWRTPGYARGMMAVHRDSSTTCVSLPYGLPYANISSVPSGGGSYLYRAYYKYVYTAKAFGTSESAQHVVYGPPCDVVSGTGYSGNVTFGGLLATPYGFYYTSPTAAKGMLYIVVCRTTNGGSVYYEVSTTAASFTYGGAFYSQDIAITTTDADLVANNVAYFQTEMPNTRLGAYISHATEEDSDAIRGFRLYNGRMYILLSHDSVYQSKADRPREFGDTAYTNIGELTYGIGAGPNGIVVTCEENLYRIDGVFEDDGSGGMVATKIGQIEPPLSPGCVVDTPEGTYWLSRTAVWFTDGINVSKISEMCPNYITTVTSRLSSTTVQHFVNGCYSPHLRKVFWCVSKNATGNQASKILVYDIGMSSADAHVFYTWANNGESDTAVAVGPSYEYPIVTSDTHGYLYNLIASPSFTARSYDYTYAEASTSSAWEKTAIRWNIETAPLDFGARGAVKYTPSMSAVFNVALYDNETAYASLYGSTDDLGLAVGLGTTLNSSSRSADLTPVLLDTTAGDHTVKRHFPARYLRCKSRTIIMANGYAAIYETADYGTVEINATLKTATFTDTASYDWPTEVVGYYISFETDNYVRDYPITVRSNDTITFSDSGNNSVTGSAKGWVIRGHPKGHVFRLLSLSIDYETNGNGLDPFNTADSKEP